MQNVFLQKYTYIFSYPSTVSVTLNENENNDINDLQLLIAYLKV